MVKQKPVKSSKLGIILITISVSFAILFVLPILFILCIGVLFSAAGSESTTTAGNVAHLTVSGAILTESESSLFEGSGGTSSRRFVEKIDKIKSDSSIKAVLIEINSPGGSGVASDEIAQAIRSLDVPVVSYIREVGASGSYWVASSTDYIFANRFSTIGSIGVIASYLDFSEFIEEYNVSYQRFVAGKNKDFGSPFREVTPEQEVRFQSILDELHSIFITEVASGRNASISDITELADGSIFTGSEALQNGLIDAIGTKKDAVKYIEELINHPVELVNYNSQPSFFESLAGYTAKNYYAMGLGIGEKVSLKTEVGADNPLIRT